MPRHRNVGRCDDLDDDLDAAKGEYDDDYLDEFDDKEDRRIDPEDDCAYTKKEFILQYGGTREWDAARSEFAAKETQVNKKVGMPKDDQELLQMHKKSGITALSELHSVKISFTPKTSGGNLMTYSGGDLSVAKVEEGLKVLLKEVKDENAKRETLKKEMAAMNGQNVMEGWPTLDTQKPMTVSYDIDKSVHHVIEGKLADVNKRLNYGKNEVAAYDPATKQLIGDTFLCIPAKFDASTVITMTGPSHKVKAGVSTFNSFLSHFKIIGNVRKVTRSDQAPKPKPKAKKTEPEKKPHEPKGVVSGKTKTPPKQDLGRGTTEVPSMQSGRGAELDPAGRGAGVDTAGRGGPVGVSPAESSGRGGPVGVAPAESSGRGGPIGVAATESAGRGAGVVVTAEPSAGRGQGVDTAATGRGTSLPDTPPPPAAGRAEPTAPPAQPSSKATTTPTPETPPPSSGRGTGLPDKAPSKGRGGVDMSQPNAGRGAGRGAPPAKETPESHVVKEQRERKRH